MVDVCDIENELRALREKKTRAWVPPLIFLGSLALFVLAVAGLFSLAGKFRYGAYLTATIVVILMVHELGHWFGMKYFGYRDMRMFFIPFFGAAVTGKTRRRRIGFQEAIVSLLGPLPGILIGAIGASVFQLLRNREFANVFMLFVLINWANLFPILPLDGGRHLEYTVFGRTTLSRLAHRALSVLALGYLAYLTSSTVIGYLALVFALSLRREYRHGQLLSLMKKSGVDVEADLDEIVPRAALEFMLPELNICCDKSRNKPREMAELSLLLWERLTQIPPRWPAVAAFLSVHAGFLILGAAALFALGFDFGTVFN